MAVLRLHNTVMWGHAFLPCRLDVRGPSACKIGPGWWLVVSLLDAVYFSRSLDCGFLQTKPSLLIAPTFAIAVE